MPKPIKLILVYGIDLLSAWPEALCANPATATYYLAQEAARQGRQLNHDDRGDYYTIGKNNYYLHTMYLLTLDNVDNLRRRHEPPHPHP